MKKGVPAATRGQGPSKQALELNMASIFTVLAMTFGPIVKGGPIFPIAAIAVGVFFLLMEIELAALTVSRVDINKEKKTATIDLPTSKTEPKGKGAKRTWGCTCQGKVDEPCPYCALETVVEWHYLKKKGLDTYLFCDISGNACKNNKMIESLNASAAKAEGPTNLTGHSFRVTGARFLAAMNLSILMIQLLGRWDSGVILKYITDSLCLRLRKRSSMRRTGSP